jgi:hypothetical protein
MPHDSVQNMCENFEKHQLVFKEPWLEVRLDVMVFS